MSEPTLYERLCSMSKSLEGCGQIYEDDDPDPYETVLWAMEFVRDIEGRNALERQRVALREGLLLAQLRGCQQMIMRMQDPELQGGIDMKQAIEECLAFNGASESDDADGNGDEWCNPTFTPNGMTVAELKAIIKDWPDIDPQGDPHTVWIGRSGISNQVKAAWPLNARTVLDGGTFADLFLEE